MLPVKHSADLPQGATRLSPGARRSFFCRMKCKSSVQIKEENDANSSNCRRNKKQLVDKKFSVIHCTGYLKSWAPAKMGLEEHESETDGECNLSLSCLVAVGRLVDYNNCFLKPAENMKNRRQSSQVNNNCHLHIIYECVCPSKGFSDGHQQCEQQQTQSSVAQRSIYLETCNGWKIFVCRSKSHACSGLSATGTFGNKLV